MPGRSMTVTSLLFSRRPSFLDRDAGKVADVLIAAGQIVEKCAFAAVLVADEGEGKAHGSSGATVILLASSSLRVSS